MVTTLTLTSDRAHTLTVTVPAHITVTQYVDQHGYDLYCSARDTWGRHTWYSYTVTHEGHRVGGITFNAVMHRPVQAVDGRWLLQRVGEDH
jgi:hypothetical protein